MVHRDPRTGQFVSNGGGGLEDLRADMDTVTGAISYQVPAADNTGALSSFDVDGDKSELIDFTGVLDDDEFFRIRLMSLSITLTLPTTASAEGVGVATWELRTDFGDDKPARSAGRFGAPPQREDGSVDVIFDQAEETSIIDAGVLTAQPSFNDGVGNSGGGNDANQHRYFRPGTDLGAELVVDEDDEITMPASLRTEGVDDHRVFLGAVLVCYGNEVRAE